jgi:hypothetical protein
MWQARINFVIGLWMALSGLNAELQTPANLMVSGFIVVALATSTPQKWQSIAIAALGFWLVLSGVITSLIAPANFISVGIIIAILALWYALAKKGKPAEVKLAH